MANETKQDVKLAQDERGLFDLVVENGQLGFVEGLETAIVVSLMTDARASESIVPNAQDRRGWVGNITTAEQGRQIGSTLWTLDQARLTSATLSRADIAANDALSHLVEDSVASEVNVEVERGNRTINVKAEIVIKNNVVERYNILWRKTNAIGLPNVR